LGYLDHSGNLYISGRSERAVTIADQTVYLDQVEALILQSNTIKHAAVFAIPHDRKGYILQAAICFENDPSDSPFESVKHLPSLVRPKKINAVADWPLLPSGKTDYKRLKGVFE
jgi:long-chain acyl-CoA synthetase